MLVTIECFTRDAAIELAAILNSNNTAVSAEIVKSGKLLECCD